MLPDRPRVIPVPDPELIIALRAVFPTKQIIPGDTMETVFFNAGAAKVISFLEGLRFKSNGERIYYVPETQDR